MATASRTSSWAATRRPGVSSTIVAGWCGRVRGDGRTLWQFFTDEMVRSSPAVGDLGGTGQPSIVFGTGNYWVSQPGGAKDSNKVFALDPAATCDGSATWAARRSAGPALADVEGNGHLDIVIGTADGPTGRARLGARRRRQATPPLGGRARPAAGS